MNEYGIADEHKLPGQGTVDWLRIIRNECSGHDFSAAEICRACDELLPDFSN